MYSTPVAELIENEWKLVATTVDVLNPGHITRMMMKLRKNNPTRLLRIWPQHVRIVSFKDNKVTEWWYEKGYSLWEKL